MYRFNLFYLIIYIGFSAANFINESYFQIYQSCLTVLTISNIGTFEKEISD